EWVRHDPSLVPYLGEQRSSLNQSLTGAIVSIKFKGARMRMRAGAYHSLPEERGPSVSHRSRMPTITLLIRRLLCRVLGHDFVQRKNGQAQLICLRCSMLRHF